MIWDDAVEKGREEGERIGSEKASERYSRLILLLSRENRSIRLWRLRLIRNTESSFMKSTGSENSSGAGGVSEYEMTEKQEIT